METDVTPTLNNAATPQQAGETKSMESKNEKSKKRSKPLKDSSGSKKTSTSQNKDKLKNASPQSPKKKRKAEGEEAQSTKTRSPKKERGMSLKEGTFVWAKMRTFPWWPGKIVTKEHKDVSQEVLKIEQPGTILVYFYGSDDFAWISPSNLKPFKSNFKEFSKTKDPEMQEAIEEAAEAFGDPDLLQDFEDQSCDVCKKKDNDDKMLLCDNCNYGYHIYCLNPPVTKVPEDNWYCDDCKDTVQYHLNLETVELSMLEPGVAGLFNLGSTCYINTAIQCLNAAPSFRKDVVDYFQALSENELITTFHEIIKTLWSDESVDLETLAKLKETSGNALEYKYHSNEHQDINEYLIQLLDYVDEQLKKHALTPKLPATNDSNNNNNTEPTKEGTESKEDEEKEKQPPVIIPDFTETLAASTLEAWKKCNMNKGDYTIIRHAFDGILSRTRTCPENHVSQSFEMFRILTLQFPRRGKSITLYSMLEAIGTEETLQCRCLTCGGDNDRKFKQRTGVYLFPKYLIIQLGRFAHGISTSEEQQWWSNKIHMEVEFPLVDLDMTKVFKDYEPSQPKPVYDLFAVANHKGTLQGGHYWSFVKTNNNTWFNFNDNIVKPMSEKDVVTPNAYMLFYQRKE